MKTIEDDLIRAIYLAGGVKEDVKDDLAKVSDFIQVTIGNL